MRRYRLIISLLVILLPIVFMIGVLSGQEDVKANPSYYQLKVMDKIESQIDCYCGVDTYCRDAFIDC